MGVIRPCHDLERPRILEIVNRAAEAYRDVIPADRWREPYMPPDELDHELSAGVGFLGYEADGSLVGVMGIQRVRDVELIRHAYVLPISQGRGVGGALLEHLQRLCTHRMLVGTWAAAEWAIRFYRRHGFRLVAPERTAALLKAYWTIPDRRSRRRSCWRTPVHRRLGPGRSASRHRRRLLVERASHRASCIVAPWQTLPQTPAGRVGLREFTSARRGRGSWGVGRATCAGVRSASRH